MARRHRIHFPHAFYHVILRGNDRQDIFFDDQDRYKFYLLLQEGTERFGHSISAFCLMKNHVHLLFQVDEVPLSRIIQNLAFRYTRWINWRHHRVGHLFQGRFKAILVDADEYLLQLVSYIHLNPVRAHLVADPADYRWSSHRVYSDEECLPWLSTREVLAFFSGNVPQARKSFLDFVKQGTNDGYVEEFSRGDSSDSRFLGSDPFVGMVYEHAEPETLQKPGITEILAAVERLYGLNEGELGGADRSLRIAEARSMAAWAVRELSDDTLTGLGHRVHRDVTSLSSSIARLSRRAKSDMELAARMEKLMKLLEFATLQA